MNKYQEAFKIVEIGEGDVKAMVNLPHEVTEQAFKTIRELVDRATLKKPSIDSYDVIRCPKCCGHIPTKYISYCRYCGQAIDWSDKE